MSKKALLWLLVFIVVFLGGATFVALTLFQGLLMK